MEESACSLPVRAVQVKPGLKDLVSTLVGSRAHHFQSAPFTSQAIRLVKKKGLQVVPHDHAARLAMEVRSPRRQDVVD